MSTAQNPLEPILAVVGIDPVLTDPHFRVRQYMRDGADSIPGKVRRMLSAFLNSDEFAPEGKATPFKYREVLDMLIEDRAPEVSERIITSFPDNPDAGMQFTAAVGAVLRYLRDILPKRTRLTPLGPVQEIPNQQTVFRFKRAHAIANDPLEALRHMAEGDLTADEVQALAAMWPATYDLIKRELFEQLAKIKSARPRAEIRHAKTRLLQRFLQVATWSDAVIKASQGSYSEEAAKKKVDAAIGPTKLGDLGQQSLTPTQRIEQK